MKSAIVTGANGFVGRAVVEALRTDGVEVFIVTHSEDTVKDRHTIYLDIENYDELPTFFEGKSPDVFYHFAWQGTSGKDRGNESIQLKNVEGTCKAVRAASQIGCKKFIFASSIMEYEVEATIKSMKIPNINDIYSVAKMSADYMSRIIAGNLKIEYISALISNIYGPGEKSVRLINSCIKKLLNGEHISLSPCNQLYDFIYISDAVKMFVGIGKKGVSGRIYYIGNSHVRPLKDYMNDMRDVISPSTELGFGEIPFNGVGLSYDEFDKDSIYRDIGIKPVVSFKDGIRMTKEYIMKEFL